MRHLKLRQMVNVIALVCATSPFAFNANADDSAPALVTPVASPAITQAKKQRSLRHRTAGDVINSVDPDLSVSLSTNGVGVGYNYVVRPSYQNGLYDRIDRWHPEASFNLIPGLKLAPRAEIMIMRQFKSKREAIHAGPIAKLKSLPFTATDVLNLEPGTIVSIPVRMEVFEGVDSDTQVAGPLTASGRVGHVDRGLYQVQAQRLDGNKVRLRILTTRQHAFQADGGLGLGVSRLHTTIASASVSKGKKSLASTEYIFDLNNAAARQAYDSMFREGHLRPRAEYANPFSKASKTAERLGDGLDRVDKVVVLDEGLNRAQRRISQSYQALGESTATDQSASLNPLGILGLRRSSSFSPNRRLSFTDEHNVQHDTNDSTYQTSRQTKLFFGLRNESQTFRGALIAETTGKNGQQPNLGKYLLTLDLQDKRMGKSETEKALVKLKRLIAPSILRQLNIEPILTSTSYKNARVYAQVGFSEAALTSLEGLSTEHIVTSLTAYLLSRKEPFADHDRAIRKSSELLSQALDKTLDMPKRMELFGTLQKEKLFRELGSGFLMSLLPESGLSNFVSVNLTVEASVFGANPVHAHYGKNDFSTIEKVNDCLTYQQNSTDVDRHMEDVCDTLSNGNPTVIAELVPASRNSTHAAARLAAETRTGPVANLNSTVRTSNAVQ